MTDATLFVGGRIYAAGRYAEALLVEGDRVVAVGPEPAVRAASPTGTDRRPLGGALVLPGLADAHLHLGELTRVRAGFDARSPRSIPELQDRLRRSAEAGTPAAIVGRGLDLERLAERRWPTVEELDRAVPDRPVVLFHASGHAAAANSAAFTRAPGLRSPGPSAPSAAFEEELGAFRPLVEEALPLTPDALEATVGELAAFGITAVGTMNAGRDELGALSLLDRSGRLTLRVRAFPPLAELGTSPSAELPSSDRLRVAGGKAFLDGAFGPRTAALEGPYEDDPSTSGRERGDDGSLSSAIMACRAAGLVPALHAIGDRAVARAARLLGAPGSEGAPGRIEHVGLAPPTVLGELRRVRAVAVVQPGFVVSDVWLRERLGAARSRWAYPFRTMIDLGIPLAGSSDAPYDPPDPWRAMRAAVDRRDDLGRSANPWPDEALNAPEALELYAGGAHRALGDAFGGRLAPEEPADLVVVAAPTVAEAVRLGAAAVVETWVGGRRIATGPASSASAS
jgi:predicted amidohydrolase YtcJ